MAIWTWLNAGSGTWNSSTNWGLISGFPDGAGEITRFYAANVDPGTINVTLPATYTVGAVDIQGNATDVFRLVGGTLNMQATSGSATISATDPGGAGSFSLGEITSALQLTSPTTVSVGGSSGRAFSLTGTISGSGELLKTGSGILHLGSSSNSFPGGLKVEAGTVRAGNINVLGAGSVLLGSSAVLDLNGFSQTIGYLDNYQGSEGIITNSSATSASVTINSSAAFFGAFVSIQNGAGTVNVIKATAGTWETRSNHTYTGSTNINAGSLVMAGDGGALQNSSAVIIAAGATLDLANATSGSVTFKDVTNDGTINVGGHTLVLTNTFSHIGAGQIFGSGGVDALDFTIRSISTSFGFTSAFTGWTDGVDTIKVTGNALANSIGGTGFADTLLGLTGNDTLTGNGGNDTLDGGSESDTASFTNSRTSFQINTTNVGGVVTTTVSDILGSSGTDTLRNVETLRMGGVDYGFAGANLNLRGNTVGSRFDSVTFHNDSTGQSYVNVFAAGALTTSGAITGANGAQWDAIDTADMNSDGIADVIYKNANDGSIAIGTSSASGVTAYTYLTTALSTTWRLVGAADVDGDAYTDLIIQNNATGFIYSADFTNLTFNEYKPVSGEGTVWQARALGDVNRDGRADIIYQNIVSGDVVAGLMTAASTVSSYLSIAAVGNWTVKEAADVNRDGYLDVVIQNNANGNISYANMAGGTFSGYGTVMNGFGTAWQLEGMADTNGDGDIDAVIRNVTGSGDTYVVNMESGAFQSFTLVAQGIGSDWYVV